MSFKMFHFQKWNVFQVRQVDVQAQFDEFGVSPREKASGSYKTGYIFDGVSILKFKMVILGWYSELELINSFYFIVFTRSKWRDVVIERSDLLHPLTSLIPNQQPMRTLDISFYEQWKRATFLQTLCKL